MLNKLLSTLVLAYIFVISWTDTFSLGKWFPMHVVITIVIIPFFLLQVLQNEKLPRQSIKKEDTFIFLLIFTLFLGLLRNYSDKSINYIAAYILIFICEFIIIKLVIYKNVKLEKVLYTNFIAVVFVSIFVLLEFSLNHFLNINIQEFLPRTRVNSATYLRIYTRSYGLATEPGVLAFYYNTMGVLAIGYLWTKSNTLKYKKIIFTTLILLAFFTTFSSAGFTFILLAIAIVKVLNLIKNPNKNIKLNKIITFSIIVFSIFFLIAINSSIVLQIQEFITPIINKVTLGDNVHSASDRVSRWVASVDNIKENPILGKGLGSTSVSGVGSSTNWYLFLAMESGVLALIPVILFIISTFIRMLKSKHKNKAFYLTGFIAGCMHLTVMSTFYHPFLWFLIVMFNFDNDSSKNKFQNLSIGGSNENNIRFK